MEEAQRIKICTELGKQLRLLRSIPSPGYYGRVHHQPYLETASLLTTRHKEPLGPYETYGDMAAALADAAELKAAVGDTELEYHPSRQLHLDHIRSAYANSEHNEPKFTHLDLKLDNTLLKPVLGGHGEQQMYEIVLIDWTRAAWYPAWLEAVGVLNEQPVDKNFRKFMHMHIFRYYVAQGFDPFPIKDAVYFDRAFDALCLFV